MAEEPKVDRESELERRRFESEDEVDAFEEAELFQEESVERVFVPSANIVQATSPSW